MKKGLSIITVILFFCLLGCAPHQKNPAPTPLPTTFFEEAVETGLVVSIDAAIDDLSDSNSHWNDFYTIQLQDQLPGKEIACEIWSYDIVRKDQEILFYSNEHGCRLCVSLTEDQKDFLLKNDCDGKALIFTVTSVDVCRYIDASYDTEESGKASVWIDDQNMPVVFGTCTAILPDGPVTR